MSYSISNNGGEIVLESPEVDIKIATDREVYTRYRNRGEKQFSAIRKQIPYGYTASDKETFAINLRNVIIKKISEGKNGDV